MITSRTDHTELQPSHQPRQGRLPTYRPALSPDRPELSPDRREITPDRRELSMANVTSTLQRARNASLAVVPSSATAGLKTPPAPGFILGPAGRGLPPRAALDAIVRHAPGTPQTNRTARHSASASAENLP